MSGASRYIGPQSVLSAEAFGNEWYGRAVVLNSAGRVEKVTHANAEAIGVCMGTSRQGFPSVIAWDNDDIVPAVVTVQSATGAGTTLKTNSTGDLIPTNASGDNVVGILLEPLDAAGTHAGIQVKLRFYKR